MAVVKVKNFGRSSSSSSFDLDSPVSLSISPLVNLSPKNSQPKSPELLAVRTAPLPQYPSISSSLLENFVPIMVINGNLIHHLRLVHHPRRDIQAENSSVSVPPPLPPLLISISACVQSPPPPFKNWPIEKNEQSKVGLSSDTYENNEETPKPKLKTLHWDKFLLFSYFSMKKINTENGQTSPDHDALKSQEIGKNNVDFSLVKIEVEEESKEKDSSLNEWSPVRVESNSLIISVDSNSMGYIVSSASNELSYSGWAEWSPLTIVPISSIEPGKFQRDDHTVGFCVVCMIRDLVDLSMAGAFDYVSPKKIVSHLRDFSPDFDWYQQEDAHEFLQCFLNKLEYCCYNLEPQDNIVKEAFGDRFVSKLRCCNYDHFSVTHEPLIDISLEIEDIDNVLAALESFTKIKKIEFSCEKCKTQGPFEKQLIVDRAPSVVALHLKRFKNNGIFVQKVDKHVSFPLELDMLLYTNKINNEEMKYDLYAIIVHSGPSISSGHYYSFIRCAPNEWYKFNDEQVVFVEEDFVLAQEAYIMFYARSGTPWFSDYIQIHRAFVNLIIPTTSTCIPNNHAFDVGEFNNVADDTNMKHELNKIEEDDSPGLPYVMASSSNNKMSNLNS
ncbi:ubiquitin carboxyl-terminal hydrolase 9-like [Solanum stenotomum]|uniref:ubiquitin carboxyl-terminal hydrolase 9-like n=1 Tax=Solanum stenotomum TaxID=172797 RepID=UPI0020D169E0|nr:ubiquitin carboxyl-terminal hydrolase 9-like [Solanum stenotomum]